jgi:hypothetical protein
MAVMGRLAKAAGMRGRGGEGERGRREISHQREQQKKLGDPSMHA